MGYIRRWVKESEGGEKIDLLKGEEEEDKEDQKGDESIYSIYYKCYITIIISYYKITSTHRHYLPVLIYSRTAPIFIVLFRY